MTLCNLSQVLRPALAGGYAVPGLVCLGWEDMRAYVMAAQAERGTKLVVVLDDAYFGLFYHLGGPSLTESLFGRLANRHPNLLAIRLDGATKELFVWGLRCGFLSFGPGRTEGAIFAQISKDPLSL